MSTRPGACPPPRARLWVTVMIVALASAMAVMALPQRAEPAQEADPLLSDAQTNEAIGASATSACTRMMVAAYKAETHRQSITAKMFHIIDTKCVNRAQSAVD